MNLFDILGPVMVGPSSSHTAGAAKIGYVCQKLLGEEPTQLEIYLHGSFAATGEGHGTDKAIVAGVLGMQPDDERIAISFQIAKERNLKVSVHEIQLKQAHPNTAQLKLKGTHQNTVIVQAASLGGGRIQICSLDGLQTNFTGDYPTLIIRNTDKPGMVANVATALSMQGINIATMQLHRDIRGGTAAMVIESDQPIAQQAIEKLKKVDGIVRVVYLDG